MAHLQLGRYKVELMKNMSLSLHCLSPMASTSIVFTHRSSVVVLYCAAKPTRLTACARAAHFEGKFKLVIRLIRSPIKNQATKCKSFAMDALKLLKEEAARKRKALSANGVKVSIVKAQFHDIQRDCFGAR